MAKVSTLGTMVKHMMASLFKEGRMDSELGKAYTKSFIWANGRTIVQEDMVYISGRMEINTKVSSLMVLNMDKELIRLQILIHTTDFTKMENPVDMVHTDGHQVHAMSASSKKERSMEKVNG